MEIDFYTDGACPGNGRSPDGGPMGAGIVGRAGKVEKEWAIPLGLGTNQKAELLAIREALLKVHGEILTAEFWRGVQARLTEGDVLEVLPYHPYRVRVASSA